jgi:hypothetical protein
MLLIFTVQSLPFFFTLFYTNVQSPGNRIFVNRLEWAQSAKKSLRFQPSLCISRIELGRSGVTGMPREPKSIH